MLNKPLDMEDKMVQNLVRTMSRAKYKDDPDKISKIKPKKG